MAKKKAARPAEPQAREAPEEPASAAAGTVQTTVTEAKGKKGKKAVAEHKPPVDPFGNIVPNASQLGSPADGNWRPSGDPIVDVAALEAQESFFFRWMSRKKAERDVAKAEAKLLLNSADETRVTDGHSVDEKMGLHRKADTAERKAAKAEKEYKRARDAYNACKGMQHRYMTEAERPLFEQPKKRGAKQAAA